MIIVQLRDGRFLIIIIRFIPGIGFRVVSQRTVGTLPIRVLDSGRLLGDSREQVVIGGTTGIDSALGFSLFGSHDDEQVVEMINRMDNPVPRGTVSIHEG